MGDKVLPPGATIGILGGGQLGRMLAQAAATLGFRCHVYSDVKDAPAFDVAAVHTRAAFDDRAALDAFARSIDAATVEFENIPVAALRTIGAHVTVLPPSRALEIAQDRREEKAFLDSLGISVAAYRAVDIEADLQTALKEIGVPAVLKTSRLGYDGKGQVRIEAAGRATEAFESIGRAPAVLEAFVDFEMEISVVGVRARDGAMAFYDSPHNIHKGGILSESRVPAPISPEVAEHARRITKRIAGALDYVGVFCVEFFAGCPGTESGLKVNETAPRVHNSGHWSLDACLVSQFENHIRAVAGWPLGLTDRHSDAVMTNLIGADVESWPKLAGEPGAALHLYGKRRARPGRKMGHVTRLKPRTG